MKMLSIGLMTVLLLIGCCKQAEAMSGDSIRKQTICQAGYKFLVVWSTEGNALTVTQIYKNGRWHDSPPQPIQC